MKSFLAAKTPDFFLKKDRPVEYDLVHSGMSQNLWDCNISEQKSSRRREGLRPARLRCGNELLEEVTRAK